MGFAKLDHGILNSSIWAESPATRVLWITMLAMKDENGFVASSRSGLARIANISQVEFEAAILCLESPDKDSRTSDNEGRRVSKIEGGWVILNNDKYRLHGEISKEQTRNRVRRYRDRLRQSKNDNVTRRSVTCTLPSVSVSVSDSVSGIELNTTEDIKTTEVVLPPQEPKKFYSEPFEVFWREYPRKVGKGKAFKNWQVALKSGATAPDIIQGAIRYASECRAKGTEDHYMKHPEGWLTARRWEDEGVVKKSYAEEMLSKKG
jgi:hypothetical protein